MSQKREVIQKNIRRVRFRRETSEDNLSRTSSQPNSEDSESEIEDFDKQENSSHSGEGTEEDDLASQAEALAFISFGALAKAQSSLTHSKPSLPRATSQVDSTWGRDLDKGKEQQLGTKVRREFHRPNNHAPTEMSSKKAVTRRREVVPVKNRQARDPRFEPLGGSLQAITLTKAYKFLDDYRETEMKELKTAIKTTKHFEQKEKLKRALLIMESKKKAKLRKLKKQEIIDRHRKREKALVKEGKKPFYLKKSEQRKQMLIDQFSELKGKKLDHFIERRRKKVESNYKKSMPFLRRSQE